MPADYKSMGATPPEKKPLSGFIWLSGGLIIGLFVALLVYLNKQPNQSVSFSEAVQVELEKIKKTSAKSKKTIANEPVKSEYQFWTLLPEMEVLIPEEELTSSSLDNSSDLSIDESGKSYILQTGSFKNLADADRLKASLALLGLIANVQTVSVNNQQWHRVRTGPYTSTKDLYHSLSLLKQNGIKALPLEIKP